MVPEGRTGVAIRSNDRRGILNGWGPSLEHSGKEGKINLLRHGSIENW